MADSAFTEWFKNKGSEWIEKASNLFKDDDTEESEKKKKYLEQV